MFEILIFLFPPFFHLLQPQGKIPFFPPLTFLPGGVFLGINIVAWWVFWDLSRESALPLPWTLGASPGTFSGIPKMPFPSN